MTDLRMRLSGLVIDTLTKERIHWSEAVDRVKEELDELDRIHDLGTPLTEREEAKADAVAEGNPEGFSNDPEPVPDAFREETE